MKLFHSPASPFVRKVTIVAAMRGLSDKIENVKTDATKGDPDLNRANPAGRLPALIVNGEAIHDSHVICEYLDSIGTSGARLFPQSGPERWRTLTLASTADGLLEQALLAVYERRYRPENMVVQSWLDRQWDKINRTLAVLEANPPAWSASPDYGHVTLACALGYLDFRHAGTWRKDHPKMVAWLSKFEQAVPAFKATTPVG